MKMNPVAEAVKSTLQTQPVMTPPAAPAPAPAPASEEPRRNDPPPGNAEFVKPDPKLNPRNQVMAEIAARANRDADLSAAEPMPPSDGENDPGPDLETAGLEASRLAAEVEDSDPEPVAASKPVQQAAPVADDVDVQIIVDGKPMMVKQSQILDVGRRTLQKETAADMKLQMASELLAQAQRAAQQQAPQQQVEAPKAEAPKQISDEELAEIIQFGTKEQAAQAIKLLRQPQITQESLNKYVEAIPAHVEAQLEFKNAVKAADREYADLIADPYLFSAFSGAIQNARKAGDTRSHAELFTAIGEDLRVKFNRPKPGAGTTASVAATPTPTNRTMAERQAAKAQAPAAPKLASARIEGGGETERPPTRLEIINKARRARGQQPLSG